jgi:hypothetical protein
LTRDGFSRQTVDASELFADFGDGSSSALPDALRFSLARLANVVVVDVVVEEVADDGGVGETGFADGASSGRRTLGTLSVC